MTERSIEPNIYERFVRDPCGDVRLVGYRVKITRKGFEKINRQFDSIDEARLYRSERMCINLAANESHLVSGQAGYELSRTP